MRPVAARTPSWQSALELLTVGLLLAALPHLWNLPFWVYLSYTTILLLLALLRRSGRDGLPRMLNWLLGILGFIVVFAGFRLLWRLEVGTALLLLLTTLKVSEIRRRRDGVVAVFLGYFLILTVLLFEQSLQIAIYVPLALIPLTMALARLDDCSGGQTIAYQARTAVVLLLLSLPLMGLMFVVFPRLPGPLWALPQAQQQTLTGIDGSMSLGDIGVLARSSKPAFRVQFDGRLPERSRLYWRGPVLARFDGIRWTPRKAEPASRPTLDQAGNPINYRLLLEPTGRNWLFALEMPVSIPPGVALDADYQLIRDRALTTASSFHLSADLDLRPGTDSHQSALEAARRLPADSVPRSRIFAAELRRRSVGSEEYVRAVLQHFNQQPFVYTLRPQRLSGDRVDSFLFDTREGYCEHYAAAFTVLMRAAGIPARVVTGYQGGEWNELGDYLLVRQSDAHAWTEIWLPQKGWVRVDPTAAVAPERIHAGLADAMPEEDLLPLITRSSFGGQLLGRLSLGWDTLNYYWGRWVVFFDETQQLQLFARLGLNFQRWTDIALALLAGFGLLSIGWLGLSRLHRHRRYADPTRELYRKFCNRLSRRGLRRHNSEGPLAFAERVARQHPASGAAAGEICELYSRLRYGSNSRRDLSQELRRLVKTFEK